MNSETHKVIIATYSQEVLYAVPIDWDIKDIIIKYGELFYKEEKKDVPEKQLEVDYKYPNQFEDWEVDIEDYFDCEEEEEDESEDETKDNFAECCRCGEEDEGNGKQVDGEYWCVDCLDDAKDEEE